MYTVVKIIVFYVNVPCGGCAGVWVKDLEDEGVQVCV